MLCRIDIDPLATHFVLKPEGAEFWDEYTSQWDEWTSKPLVPWDECFLGLISNPGLGNGNDIQPTWHNALN